MSSIKYFIFHNPGEPGVASAAAAEGVPYVLSTAYCQEWYQLYTGREHNDMLKRTKTASYSVLLVTLDTYMLEWRPTDVDDVYSPFLRSDNVVFEIGSLILFFQRQLQSQHGERALTTIFR